MDEAHGGAEQGLDAERPIRRLGEGQTLGVGILRVVIGDDHVDHPEARAATIACRSASSRMGGERRQKVR